MPHSPAPTLGPWKAWTKPGPWLGALGLWGLLGSAPLAQAAPTPAFDWSGRYAFDPQGSDDMLQLLEREAAAMPALIGPAVLAAMRSKVKNPQSLRLKLEGTSLRYQADDRPELRVTVGGQPSRFTREGREVVAKAWLAEGSLRLRFEVAGSVQAFELVPKGSGLRQTARLEFPRYPRPIRYAHNYQRVGAF